MSKKHDPLMQQQSCWPCMHLETLMKSSSAYEMGYLPHTNKKTTRAKVNAARVRLLCVNTRKARKTTAADDDAEAPPFCWQPRERGCQKGGC